MGRRDCDQGELFYAFNVQDRIPANHLLRRIDPFRRHLILHKDTFGVTRDRSRRVGRNVQQLIYGQIGK